MSRPPVPPLTRLLRQVAVDLSTGCWSWSGAVSRNGYGQIGMPQQGDRHRTELAHRASYLLFVGPVADGLELDHLCRNRACVRPDHLEPVTASENVRRSSRGSATHCRNGHPLGERGRDGRRHCAICGRDRQRRYAERKRAGASRLAEATA